MKSASNQLNANKFTKKNKILVDGIRGVGGEHFPIVNRDGLLSTLESSHTYTHQSNQGTNFISIRLSKILQQALLTIVERLNGVL